MSNEQKYSDKTPDTSANSEATPRDSANSEATSSAPVSDADKALAMEHYNRGKEYWRQGRRGDAMSEYNKAVLLDPHSPAATALEMANTIMDFYDHDRYNP